MADVGWLAEQARQIHDVFSSLFFIILTTLLLLGVFVEYFKWPLGEAPAFTQLVGRAFIAVFLLHTYPEVSNAIADCIDGLAQKLGDLNQFNLVLAQMGQKLHEFTYSWVSVKEIIIWVLSFLTFFLLYISVHAVNAFALYTWTILYVTAPFLIVLFVLPSTSQVTKSLYKSLIEIALWKVVWSILATLLWSFALSKINHSEQQIPFVTVIFLNLILAGSILMTPTVVHALANGGFSALAGAAGGLVAGSTMMAPKMFATAALNKAKPLAAGVTAGTSKIQSLMSAKTQVKPSQSNKMSAPPKWHKDVPFPTEPPPYMKSRLEKEKSK